MNIFILFWYNHKTLKHSNRAYTLQVFDPEPLFSQLMNISILFRTLRFSNTLIEHTLNHTLDQLQTIQQNLRIALSSASLISHNVKLSRKHHIESYLNSFTIDHRVHYISIECVNVDYALNFIGLGPSSHPPSLHSATGISSS